MMNAMKLVALALMGALIAAAAPRVQAEPEGKWHHLHLTATDQQEAADWYAKYMEGSVNSGPAGPVAVFGDTVVVFFKKEAGFEGSRGSSVDHVGWSFEDLDAKMVEFEEAGIEIVAPARAIGTIKFGFIKDPWGTIIEVMQDPELYGFHHIHLHTPDPDVTLKFYSDAFGGEITKYMGFLPAIKYQDMWLIAQKQADEKAPTKGRSVDHLGFSFADLDAEAARLKEMGVKFTMDPRPFGPLKISFIEGPEGVLIEVVQPPAAQ